jgi:hypothetical protein
MIDQASLVEHPTTSWEAMNDGAVFYSKKHLYQMQWNLGLGGGGGDLAGYIVAAAKLGGPMGPCFQVETPSALTNNCSNHERQFETSSSWTNDVHQTGDTSVLLSRSPTRYDQCTSSDT